MLILIEIIIIDYLNKLVTHHNKHYFDNKFYFLYILLLHLWKILLRIAKLFFFI